MTTSVKKGRPPAPVIERDDQLGTLKAVAQYMGVGRTWVCGVKRRYLELVAQKQAGELRDELPPAPFGGGLTCAAWLTDFVRHPINASFNATRAYHTPINPRPKARSSTPPSRGAGPAASASGKSG